MKMKGFLDVQPSTIPLPHEKSPAESLQLVLISSSVYLALCYDPPNSSTLHTPKARCAHLVAGPLLFCSARLRRYQTGELPRKSTRLAEDQEQSVFTSRRVARTTHEKEIVRRRSVDHCSFAYSALASLRMGMSGSASFQRERKS